MSADLAKFALIGSLMASSAVTAAVAQTDVPTVSFERSVELSFDEPPEAVCPLFDPRTRQHQFEPWMIETLYEP